MTKFKSEIGASISKNVLSLTLTAIWWDISDLPFVQTKKY